MNTTRLVALLTACLAASAQAQSRPPDALAPSRPAQADPAGDDEAPAELVTLVLGLQGRAGVGADTVRVLNNLITFELGKTPGRRVLGMNDIKSLLEAEATKQLLDCNAQSCLAELAGAVDADRVVYGSVEKIGRGYFLILSEMDARTVEPVARAQRRLLDPSPDRLTAEVPGIVDELMRGGSATASTGVLIVTADAQVEIVVEGRGAGGAPAVIDDAPVGDVEVTVYYQELPLTVTVPVHPARVTTVNVSLDALVGDVGPEEADEAFSDAMWTAGGGLAGLACGGMCCGTSPLGCLCGGLFANILGIDRTLDDGMGGQASLGSTVGFGANVMAALAIMAGGGVAVLWAPFMIAGDVDSAHVVEVKPPDGEGDPRTIELDPKTGKVVEAEPVATLPAATAPLAVRF